MKEWVKVGYPTTHINILYYILQFTWGLPMNIAGFIMYIILRIAKYEHCRFGKNLEIIMPGITWGLSMGIFAIVPDNEYFYNTSVHEHGHAIQNIIFGPLMLFVVFLPSIIRFWYRNIRVNILHKELKTAYDDAWFEGSATATGRRFVEKEMELK